MGASSRTRACKACLVATDSHSSCSWTSETWPPLQTAQAPKAVQFYSDTQGLSRARSLALRRPVDEYPAVPATLVHVLAVLNCELASVFLSSCCFTAVRETGKRIG